MQQQIAFLFSGQGSQYYQMGKELFNENKIFKHYMLQADQICLDLTGISIIEHLYDDAIRKSQPFTRTLLTNPAILMVEHALMRTLLERNIYPDLVLGTSLGELSAAITANVLNFETALQIVIKQAEILEQHCQPGGMLAILHEPSLYQEEPFLYQFSELAGINFPSHFVVSGRIKNLEEIIIQLNAKNISSQLLPVSFAFHSSLIDNVKNNFLTTLQETSLQEPQIPFISCCYSKQLFTVNNDYFWDVIRLPIQFQATIQFLENKQETTYLDVGPSGTLATFVKYNLAPNSLSKTLTLLSPFSKDVVTFENALQNIAINNHSL